MNVFDLGQVPRFERYCEIYAERTFLTSLEVVGKAVVVCLTLSDCVKVVDIGSCFAVATDKNIA